MCLASVGKELAGVTYMKTEMAKKLGTNFLTV
jgi:hypothetical protein